MILAEAGKFVGAKVATAVIFLAVVAGAVWCYQHPDELKSFGHVVKHTIIWVVVVAALPWSSYVFMGPLLRLQAGLASAGAATAVSVAVLAGFCLIDVLFAFYLTGWSVSGTFSWMVLLLGFLAAGTYNFVICESLARHEDA